MKMPSEAPLFDIAISPRWGDQDPMGHINNVQYFRYLEEARIQWIQGSQFAGDNRNEAFSMMIVNAGLNFRMEWRHPDALRAMAWVTAIGNSSLTLQQCLYSPDGNQCVADGPATLVWMDMRAKRPAPIPQRQRDLLQAHLIEL